MSPVYVANEFPEDFKDQILSIIGDRLGTGEVLISESQFVAAMEESFQSVSRATLDDTTKQKLVEIVRQVNTETPEVLLVPGIENWVTKSVLASVRKQDWGVTEVQERGNQLVRQFVRGEKVQALLSQLGLQASQLNLKRSYRSVLNQVAGKADVDQKRAAARLAQLKTAASKMPASVEGEGDASAPRRVTGGLDRLLDGPADMPTEEEAQSRTAEQEHVQGAMRKAQLENLVTHLDSYVQQGMLSADDAERLRKANKVDEAVRSGRVDKERGSKIRNSILDGTARDKIEKKVGQAVDFSVRYLQVFESLRRVEPRFDNGLRLLVRHKDAVNADRGEDGEKPAEIGPFVNGLLEDMDALEQIIDLMDRKDAEVRMIAAHLPPYSNVMRRDQGRIENMVIDETFMDLLRAEAGSESVTEKLNCADKVIRSRAAGDMLCMTSILNRLVRPTPVRKEIRLLKINLIIEEFYRSDADIEQARSRAQDFLKTRLRSMYSDLSEEETAEIQQRGAEIIDAVEQKIVKERQEQAVGKDVKATAAAGADDAKETEEPTLSEEEEQLGVQIHRVAVRIAGRVRSIPYKVMPDADDSSKFIIVQKDPDSGEMVPVRRRGQKRFVHRDRDGGWQLT